jgi:shikimate dehydrogenase
MRASTAPIQARSLRVGLIGAGIGASRTPAMHVAEGRAQGLDYSYDLIDTDRLGLTGPDELGGLLDRLQAEGYAGVNVTYPWKRAVLAHVDRLADSAAVVGAANTVVFGGEGRVAHNTDYSGFAEAFRAGRGSHPHAHALLLGAGGAGGAVAQALLDIGVRRLAIHDVNLAAAVALARAAADRLGPGRVRVAVDLAIEAGEADLIVNATPVGMAKHPGCPLDPALLEPRHLVVDIVYFPLETELLARARARGCATMDGSGMAVHQAAAAFALFTGLPADVARMRATFDRGP